MVMTPASLKSAATWACTYKQWESTCMCMGMGMPWAWACHVHVQVHGHGQWKSAATWACTYNSGRARACAWAWAWAVEGRRHLRRAADALAAVRRREAEIARQAGAWRLQTRTPAPKGR